jgi:hypothetical protein
MRPTEILMLIDQSGSMASCSHGLKEGFKTFIEEQKQDPSECFITLTTFNTSWETLHMGSGNGDQDGNNVQLKSVAVREPIQTCPLITDAWYRPTGGTPILDAIGFTINRAKYMISDSIGAQVVLAIVTDGEENASTKYTGVEVAAMLKYLQKAGWQFLWISIGADTLKDAMEIGIPKTAYFELDDDNPKAIKQALEGASQAVLEFREKGTFNVQIGANHGRPGIESKKK